MTGGRPRVLPREEGTALRALRLTVAPRALVTRAGTDVVVRTPSRPDHRAGNVVDLLVPPAAADVPALVARVRRLLEPTGVDRPHLRWERPVGAADPAVAAALVAAGAPPRVTRVLGIPAPEAPGPAGVARLPVPGRDPGADDTATARRWHGAEVLQRYAEGDLPATWRARATTGAAWDAWDRARVRELAALGRADVWLATAQGIPVATLTVLRDGAGAAHLEDLVTHPAHRRRGLATGLVAAAVAAEHAAAPGTLVTAEVVPGGASEALLTGLGAVTVAEVVAALVAPDADAGPGPEGPHR